MSGNYDRSKLTELQLLNLFSQHCLRGYDYMTQQEHNEPPGNQNQFQLKT